jgi:hypothetical protein
MHSKNAKHLPHLFQANINVNLLFLKKWKIILWLCGPPMEKVSVHGYKLILKENIKFQKLNIKIEKNHLRETKK